MLRDRRASEAIQQKDVLHVLVSKAFWVSLLCGGREPWKALVQVEIWCSSLVLLRKEAFKKFGLIDLSRLSYLPVILLTQFICLSYYL